MMAYAVLGPIGTFSEEAVRLYAGCNIEVRVTENIVEVFALVEREEISDGFVPLENSSAGMISTTMECLSATSLKIKGALEVPVKQCLLANGDFTPDQAELLISQPAALEQCRQYIKSNLKRVRIEIADSTARAAQLVQGEKRRAAAIGGRQAGRIYGLNIIATDIQDGLNYTRFVHVGKNGSTEVDRHKSSLLLSLPDKVGALYELLGVFARSNLNLKQIDSRPGGSQQEYIFYIEVEQGKNDIIMELFLEEIAPYCNWSKYLGSYTQRRIIDVDCGPPYAS